MGQVFYIKKTIQTKKIKFNTVPILVTHQLVSFENT